MATSLGFKPGDFYGVDRSEHKFRIVKLAPGHKSIVGMVSKHTPTRVKLSTAGTLVAHFGYLPQGEDASSLLPITLTEDRIVVFNAATIRPLVGGGVTYEKAHRLFVEWFLLHSIHRGRPELMFSAYAPEAWAWLQEQDGETQGRFTDEAVSAAFQSERGRLLIDGSREAVNAA
ncbi:hypothetical protein EON81_24180 [bacterium]|nr:MAG: hypothetical protein EON81_24180 [bacterium]